MSIEENHAYIGGYLDSLKTQRKLSPHTLSGYGRDLAELLVFADTLGGNFALPSITHFHIRRLASQLHAKGLNPRSIARKLSSWRGFFNWLSGQTALASNPVDGIKAPKRSKPLPKALAADDAVRLVSKTHPGKNPDSASQQCNRAMFELLYSSGLRVSELVGLDARYSREADHVSAGWIDFDASEVTVTGKGSKMRSIPVGQPALRAVKDWLAIRSTLLERSSDNDRFALFLTDRGKRMSPRVVQTRLKAHAQALGIPADVHPHVLRHSFASHVLQSSGDLRAVQEMLGHASIAATQVYTSLDFQRLAQVYDAAHPRAKKRCE
ncbi:MAG: recombinase XerC [Burkholderiales bacterium RIFCSPLOWO2_02_FULL_57_36]|nr:MAG: recombinase XerC [Burkholderiales bacterium RIFCSPLOWO2_02_FULL_57_36]